MTIFGRQPAVWIGLIVSLIAAVLSVLTGHGFISDALAGRVTDLTNSIAQLLTLLAPLIAGLLIKPVVTPVAAPVLPANTVVTTPEGKAAVVTPA